MWGYRPGIWEPGGGGRKVASTVTPCLKKSTEKVTEQHLYFSNRAGTFSTWPNDLHIFLFVCLFERDVIPVLGRFTNAEPLLWAQGQPGPQWGPGQWQQRQHSMTLSQKPKQNQQLKVNKYKAGWRDGSRTRVCAALEFSTLQIIMGSESSWCWCIASCGAHKPQELPQLPMWIWSWNSGLGCGARKWTPTMSHFSH